MNLTNISSIDQTSTEALTKTASHYQYNRSNLRPYTQNRNSKCFSKNENIVNRSATFGNDSRVQTSHKPNNSSFQRQIEDDKKKRDQILRENYNEGYVFQSNYTGKSSCISERRKTVKCQRQKLFDSLTSINNIVKLCKNHNQSSNKNLFHKNEKERKKEESKTNDLVNAIDICLNARIEDNYNY